MDKMTPMDPEYQETPPEWQPGTPGYYGTGRLPKPPRSHTGLIVVLYTVRRGPHGTTYVPGKAYWCWCSIEGREQQAGMFSISGAEDKSPQTWGGLREVTPSQVVAVEWHGDIHTEVWYQGDCYDVDGAPTFRQHGEVPHYEMHIRRNADYSQIPVGLRPKPPEPDPDDHVWGEADGKSFH